MTNPILASVLASRPFGGAPAQLIRLVCVQDHLATVEVVTRGGEPAVGSLSSALGPAGIRVVFCETQFAGGAFRERINIANEGSHAFTRTRLRQVMELATAALRRELGRAADETAKPHQHGLSAPAGRAA